VVLAGALAGASQRAHTMGGTMEEGTSILQAPDFTLADVNGRDVSLADFAGQKHVILVFNRGFQ